METVITLRYGNTNTFLVRGGRGNLLIDTDWAGTLDAFRRALKEKGLHTEDIGYVLATHYHPDHAGLIGMLMRLGTRLVLMETQAGHVNDPDGIFAREGRSGYVPADETRALLLSFGGSRAFLEGLGIRGEIFATPSHSPDSVSVYLDEGICIVGDLEPYAYLAAYGENAALRRDWDRVLDYGPAMVYHAHANAVRMAENS